ncbi:DUF342 domain-containing protein [Butyrivibrio proteoclasticus]|uniref:DUF342 domain-containing protein n=1 Tax=Butyrivibrio proteoclasticus TaxID=43305 RepID=UPI00047C85F4|nr:FapA family protein [Butyrivibrio proteoclasticus]
MAAAEVELIDDLNIYKGLDSFNSNVYEKEIEKCKELGADVAKIEALKFNALQLSEIRKGLEDKVDVSKYMDPKYSWTDMEEMRLEMSQGIDMSSYRAEGFDTQQLSQIRQGIAAGADVSNYAKRDYLADQMKQIRLGLTRNGGVPIIFYQDPEFDAYQMREIRKGLEAGIDISVYALSNVPYMKMRAIRKSAEDGLIFEKSDIDRYNASILEELHEAYLEKVDISKYVKERYDADQLEQIRICIKDNLPIDEFLSSDMRGDAIKEVRLGLESGVDVSQYADGNYGWKQMNEMRLGLEHQIDITPYCKPLFQADQMREIRLGIEEGLDVSKYATFMYTAKDMRRIREKMLSGEFSSTDSEKGSDDIFGRVENLTGNAAIIENLLANRDNCLFLEQDNMLCYLQLPEALAGKINEDLIMTFLFKVKIRKGIDKAAIALMCKRFDSKKKYLVASGKEVVNGQDGYYEYFFDTEDNDEPEILEDGTADLSKLSVIKQIHVGEKIAVYHRATKGEDGFNVFGEVVKAKLGKEIPILKGEGFMILNDRVTYVAKYTGAISMKDGIIKINKVMVVPEVKITDKKINYDGFVYVVGNVNSGSEIRATGDIVIGGHMESSTISSNGNVVIMGGVTCPIRGSIEASGDVSAKFLEGVSITANNISANYFINCTVNARGLVKTYGRVGIIYGGAIQSLYGIETASVGNKTQAKTIINLGVTSQLLAEYGKLQKEIAREEENVKALNTEKERLAEVGTVNAQVMQWKIKINAAISQKEIAIKKLMAKKESMEAEIGKGSNATAVITETAYAGTIFVIDGIALKIEEDRKTYSKMIFKTNAQKDSIEVTDG